MNPAPVDPTIAPLACGLARAAGDLLRARFGGPARGVTTKSSRTDMVSDADRDAEALILGRLRTERPEDAVLAEEGGGAVGRGTGHIRWVIDPLDGTTNFLWGIPHWSVSIAVHDAGGPAVGVVYDPCRDELFHAIRGAGARLGDGPLRIDGPAPPLDEALVGTGFNYLPDERARQATRVAGLLPRVRDVRRFGSAALDLAWLAAGRLDAYYETGLNPWDWEAGALLVAEAGGRVERIAAPAGGPPLVIAARPALFDALAAHVV